MKKTHIFALLMISTSFLTYAQEKNKKSTIETDSVSISFKIEQVVSDLVGRIGVAAKEIGGDEVIAINGEETFVMASTFKVAVAVAVLDRVDKGELKLDQLIDITPEMIIGGDQIITQQFVHPGIQLSVGNLIEVMITESDNTAADACLTLAGGPEAVTKKLRSLGITGQRVDRSVAQGMKDFYHLPAPATEEVVKEHNEKYPDKPIDGSKANLKFEKDPRDQTTPLAMLELLLAIDNGTAVSKGSCQFLLGSMSRTRTANGRLKGLLPKNTFVEHKSGTLGGVANDVGFITLPNGKRFAIAVYTSASETPAQDRDRAIAEVSRMLYDYYYLSSEKN